MTYSPKWQCRATGPDLKSQLTDPRGRGSKHSRNTDPWNPLITECQVSSDCFDAEEDGTMVPRETDSLACFPGSHEALLSQKFVTSKKARQSWSPGAEDQPHSPTSPSSCPRVRWGHLYTVPVPHLFYGFKAPAFSQEEPVGLEGQFESGT